VIRSSRAAPRRRAVDANEVALRFAGHATALLGLQRVRVLTDPFLRPSLGPLERHGPVPDPASLEADIVLISHGHPDHFDARSIDALPGRPVIVVPRGLGWPLRARVAGSPDVIEVEAGETLDLDGVRVQAVEARHWISPGAPRAKPVGYVVDAGRRVYFAGDTGRFPEMPETLGRIDLALLPVWSWGPHLGPGHLGPRSAAEVARDIGAAAVVPIHWGTLYPRQLHRLWRRALEEPGPRFLAHLGRLDPRVDVRVLRPGETTLLFASGAGAAGDGAAVDGQQPRPSEVAPAHHRLDDERPGRLVDREAEAAGGTEGRRRTHR
jgi:L-ascorbate metabolism protein UlaG (beta-lactamase superfamily)